MQTADKILWGAVYAMTISVVVLVFVRTTPQNFLLLVTALALLATLIYQNIREYLAVNPIAKKTNRDKINSALKKANQQKMKETEAMMLESIPWRESQVIPMIEKARQELSDGM